MPDPKFVPDRSTIFGWIEQVFDQGVRRPGYEADRWAEQFVLDHFERFGLSQVRRERVETPCWTDHDVELRVGTGGTGFDVPCFAVPYSEPTTVSADLVRYDPADPAAVAGQVAVYELGFGALPPTFPVLARQAATVEAGPAQPAQEAGWVHDPDGTFGDTSHRPPFARELMETMEPAIAAGAVGFVGVLRGYPAGGYHYYVPYDGEPRPIPGVYVGEQEGLDLLALLDDGPVPATIRVEGERRTETGHNVVGELAGADEEWLVIGTHHDGPWASAVEDGSGIALVLAQARYWSQVPQGRRPHRLVFTVNAAHMAGGRGTLAFIDRHRAQLDRIVLEVHLEHAARECAEVDGRLAPLDTPVPRWWFTSEIPDLEAAVWDAVVAEQLDRSLLLTPTSLGPRPTTDGGFFHEVGVPLVNYLTAPWYLFDPADTPDKIHEESLEPVTRATIRILEATAGVSAADLRAGHR